MIGRKDENGPQVSGINEDVSFTLNATDHHAVAHPVYCTRKNSHNTIAEKELANTMVATDYKDPPCVAKEQTVEPHYIRPQDDPDRMCDATGFPRLVVCGSGYRKSHGRRSGILA